VKAGKLVHVLEQFAPTAPGVFLYYPGNRQMMPKLRAFIDHMKRSSGALNQASVSKLSRNSLDGGDARMVPLATD
jgi:hypothetical protein